MTRVHLKGLHAVRSKLASGEVAVYYYAWRGGPRLNGKPGDPGFVEAFAAAHAAERAKKPDGTFRTILDYYRERPEFTELADKTRKDYSAILLLIEREFGDLPIAALAAPEARGAFLDWRDSFMPKKRRADYAWSVLARVCAVAKDRGKITVNPCERGGRLYRASRAELVWTEADLEALFAQASAEVAAVVTVALWTGQRQGDVLKMAWSAYDGETIRVRQAKGDKRLRIAAGAPLRALIAGLPRRGPIMLTSSEGTPWTSDGFRASFRRACAKAGLGDLHFHDLRGTAVTRLAMAGCSVPEIAAVTGHTLDETAAILDRHYLGGQGALARAAISKLEAAQKKG